MGFKTDDEDAAVVSAIKRVMGRQFRSLSWSREKEADWNGFAETFLPGATLFPAARPVKLQTVDEFMDRMKRLRAEGKLATFEETPLGCEVRVFGNVAVAVAGCQITENDKEVSRGVEMMLLIKQEGRWRIVAQAWDMENDSKKLPSELIGL